MLSISATGEADANKRTRMRLLLVAMFLFPGAAPLLGVTMQQLTVDDLAMKSTAIVRGRVLDSYTAMLGPTVYTHYHIGVTDIWKGAPGSSVDVALPGGTASGIRQTYPGIPQLTIGQDYVIYLWTSNAGMTMPTGFSQGIFSVLGGSSATPQLSRPATADLMLDASGNPVQDHAISMPLAQMKARVTAVLAKSGSGR
jgi:hypothetical protein